MEDRIFGEASSLYSNEFNKNGATIALPINNLSEAKLIWGELKANPGINRQAPISAGLKVYENLFSLSPNRHRFRLLLLGKILFELIKLLHLCNSPNRYKQNKRACCIISQQEE